MFKANRSHVSIDSDHRDFTFSPDGIKLVPCASIEIAQDCHYEYKLILAKCLDQGWLRPIAQMRETEYTLALLKK